MTEGGLISLEILISVIVPVYNAEKYLSVCIDSLIGQTVFDKIEIIIIDDGSTDSSPKICDSYSQKHENIEVIHQQNAGVSAARNCGIEKARGKYIGFADADDYLYPEMYERLFNLAEATGSDISLCGFLHPFPDKDVIITYPFEQNTLLNRDYIRQVICPFMLRNNTMNSVWNKIFRRDLIVGNSIILSPGKKLGEDREFFLRALSKAEGISYSDYTGYYYRYVEGSTIQKPKLDYADTILEQYDLDIELFGSLGIKKEEIESICIFSTASQTLCALSFANNKLKGAARTAVMKSIIENERIRELLFGSWDKLMHTCNNFDRLLLIMMKKNSIIGIRAVMTAMKIKVRIYNTIKRL